MAICQVCAKSKQYGHNVSHSKRRTKRVFKPNVFRKRMLVETQNSKLKTQNHRSKLKTANKKQIASGGNIQRIKICSKCLKRAKKFGEVRAAQGAQLKDRVVKVVDWVEREKIKEERAKIKEQKVKIEKEKVEKEKTKEKKAVKEEVSIEELVGKKKN